MRTSGTGSHRRPRQAPKFVVTVGATGAGIALPLIASAGSAHAATTSVWDRVAACESGGNWSAQADGFAGGLGLTQGAWLAHGGTDYADSPDLASRDQQITVAQRVLAENGPQYWGRCADTAGLTTADTTAAPAPSPSDGTGLLGGLLGGLTGGGSGGGTGTGGSASGGGAGGTATATPSPGATDPGAPAGGTPTATAPPATGGTASAPPADPAAPTASAPTGDSGSGTASAGSGPTGRHARPVPVGDDGTASPLRLGRGAHARPEVGEPSESLEPVYIVRPGDDLYRIAAEQHVPGGWRALYHANASVLGGDPGIIRPGQSLVVD